MFSYPFPFANRSSVPLTVLENIAFYYQRKRVQSSEKCAERNDYQRKQDSSEKVIIFGKQNIFTPLLKSL